MIYPGQVITRKSFVIGREREKERERERTERERDRETERKRESEGEKERERGRVSEREREPYGLNIRARTQDIPRGGGYIMEILNKANAPIFRLLLLKC